MRANVWSVFEQTARRVPDKQAIVGADGAVTFEQWRTRALEFAAFFDTVPLARHDRVILWMNASPEMAAVMLGLWAIGAIPVLMDPNERASHLEHAIATVSPRLIMLAPDTTLPVETDVRMVNAGEVRADAGAARPRPALPTDPASIVFTSGSTGRPKGATQSHRNLVHACRTVGGYLGYENDERILCTIPWSFDYGYGQLLTTAMIGATHIIPAKLNPFAICEAIEQHRPTVLPVIPSIITYLLQGLSPFPKTDVSSIRIVTNTGGAIPVPILNRMLEKLPDARVFLNFGLTETYRTSFLDPALVRQKPTSIGKPIPGVDLVLVREDGSIVDTPGEIGQLVHRGDYIFMGYWNDPERSAKALRPDPLVDPTCPDPRAALFTGDLASFDADGHFYHVGRIDHQIKSMGVRVSPGEIEELIHASGLVREVGVFGVAHDMLGHEVWAAVVRHDSFAGEDVSVEIGSYARTTMSPYMIPRRYLVLDALPKTRTGKTDYPALREMAAKDASAPIL